MLDITTSVHYTDSTVTCTRFFLSRSRLRELVLASLEDARPSFTHLQPLLHQPGNPLLALLQGHRDLVSSVATTMIERPDEKGPLLCIVSSSWDKTLKSWDLGSTGVLKSFDGHTDKVLSVAISSDGMYAISGSADTTVRWVEKLTCFQQFMKSRSLLSNLASTCLSFGQMPGKLRVMGHSITLQKCPKLHSCRWTLMYRQPRMF